MQSNKQIHIFKYLENKKAHSNCSYSNGLIEYKGNIYNWEQFDKEFPIKNIQKVISKNNKETNKNPDKTKID
jgi:hypothetical protein